MPNSFVTRRKHIAASFNAYITTVSICDTREHNGIFRLDLNNSENNAITIVKQWLFMIMNTIMIVYGQYFSLNIMVEDRGTCSCQVSLMSDYLYILISWNFCHIFYKILYEITIQIARQSTILFMNSPQ